MLALREPETLVNALSKSRISTNASDTPRKAPCDEPLTSTQRTREKSVESCPGAMGGSVTGFSSTAHASLDLDSTWRADAGYAPRRKGQPMNHAK